MSTPKGGDATSSLFARKLGNLLSSRSGPTPTKHLALPRRRIRQKNTTNNRGSTVATTSEAADFPRLLFARLGRTCCTKCSARVTRDGLEPVTGQPRSQEPESRWYAVFPIQPDKTVEEVQDGERSQMERQ